MRARNPNILSGVIFMAIGAVFLAGGVGLPLGTAQRMGPGWFPVAVSACLIAVGMLIAGRGMFAGQPALVSFVWRPLLIISAALALFIVSLDRLGLALAVSLTVVVSAFAHPPASPAKIVPYALVLAAFCSVVFVRLLGLQMPIVGSWLTPWLGHW